MQNVSIKLTWCAWFASFFPASTVQSRLSLCGAPPAGCTSLAAAGGDPAALFRCQLLRPCFAALPRGLAALLFIVPFTRTGPVWDDLKSRCTDARAELADEAKAHGVRWARVDGRVLALTTWKVLLGALACAAESAGRRDIEQDIVQLRGLTDHMRQGVHVPKVHKTKGHAFWIHIDGYDQENGDDCGFIYETVHGKWIADDVLMGHLPELEGMVAGSSTIRNEVRRKAELERTGGA